MSSSGGSDSVDVVVTVEGYSNESVWAIRRGGGLVGTRSMFTSIPARLVEFVDWPFLEDRAGGFSVEEHIAVVEQYRPRYAVAPDIELGRSLDEVVAIGDELAAFAETVILIPKQVPPDQVPDRFRVGVPFRNGFATNLGRNTYSDFDGLSNVHLLGGNPNAHFFLRDRHRLGVASVDTPLPLSWADFGRVFVGGGAGGVEVDDLVFAETQEMDPGTGEVRRVDLRTRAGRVEFSVANIREAWETGQITYEFRPFGFGTGQEPITEDMVADPSLTPDERAELERQQKRALAAQGRESLGAAPQETVTQSTLDCIPEELIREDRRTKVENEGADVEGAASRWDKLRRFTRLQQQAEGAIEQAGLGEFQLPDRGETDDVDETDTGGER